MTPRINFLLMLLPDISDLTRGHKHLIGNILSFPEAKTYLMLVLLVQLKMKLACLCEQGLLGDCLDISWIFSACLYSVSQTGSIEAYHDEKDLLPQKGALDGSVFQEIELKLAWNQEAVVSGESE